MDHVKEAFTLLGVSPDASLKEVRSAYRKLVRSWHPDRFSSDPQLQRSAQERLKAINAAYNVARQNISASPPPAAAAEHDSPFRFDRPIITTPPPVPGPAPPASPGPAEHVDEKRPCPWVANVLFGLLGFAFFCVSITRYGMNSFGVSRFLQIIAIPLVCSAACNYSAHLSEKLRSAYLASLVLLAGMLAIDAVHMREQPAQPDVPVVEEHDGFGGRVSTGGGPFSGGEWSLEPPRRGAAGGPDAPVSPYAPAPPVAPAPAAPLAPIVPPAK